MTIGERDSLQLVQHRRRIVLGFLAAVSGAMLLFARSLWEFERPAHEIIENIGVAMIALCIGGRVWCSLYLGGRKKRMVVREGPFSFVRNPLYVFSVIGAAGVGLCTGSVVISLALALLVWLVFDSVVRREEAFLHNRLGAEYAAYLRRTPRWIPDFSLWRSAETLEIRPGLAWRTLRDAMWFLLAFPVLEMIEEAQIHHLLPSLLRLP